jgi:cell division protein FtsL
MLVRVSILVFAVFCIVSFVVIRLRQNDYMAQAEALRQEIDQISEHINELQAELDRPFDSEYVAEVAHEKLGLRFPQEIVFYSGDDN